MKDFFHDSDELWNTSFSRGVHCFVPSAFILPRVQPFHDKESLLLISNIAFDSIEDFTFVAQFFWLFQWLVYPRI